MNQAAHIAFENTVNSAGAQVFFSQPGGWTTLKPFMQISFLRTENFIQKMSESTRNADESFVALKLKQQFNANDLIELEEISLVIASEVRSTAPDSVRLTLIKNAKVPFTSSSIKSLDFLLAPTATLN